MTGNRIFLLIMLLLAGCGAPAGEQGKGEQDKLIVAAAANVQFAMKELEAAFEGTTGIEVEVITSSSGKLTAQIQQGAPYDLLLSANMKYPNSLYEKGLAAAPPRIYARGALVVFTMREMNIYKDPSFLQDSTIAKIAVANPKIAPYGEEAVRLFRHFNIYEAVQPKLIYGENISQTTQYILTRAADAGITAKSVVLSPEMKGRGRWVECPPQAYDPIEQGVVITKYGAANHPEASRQFYDFLFSAKGQAVFERYGYLLPAAGDL